MQSVLFGRTDCQSVLRSVRIPFVNRSRPSPGGPTPAHRTALSAVRDFFNRQAQPVQPIAFTHKVHLANAMQCTNNSQRSGTWKYTLAITDNTTSCGSPPNLDPTIGND